jgi:DNA adenine methylase
MMTSNVSPLRYPGGKTRACKIIEKVIIEHLDITSFDTIISPFFGGGSFEFYMQNKYGVMLIANDKHTPLYNFWKQVKIDKEALCEGLRAIATVSVSKEQFVGYRKTIMDLDADTLQQAIQYFVINRCSFSGSTLSGGFSEEASRKRFTLSSIQKIEALDFTNIEIYNEDFYDFLTHPYPHQHVASVASVATTLLFLDPPYYLERKSKLYGNNGDLHEGFDHLQLFNFLKDEKRNWVLTYNNCAFIRDLYKDFTIIDVNWKYGMNTSKQSSEIIIINHIRITSII